MYIVLVTRLGYLDIHLKPDSEPQMLIGDIQMLLDCLYQTEVQLSVWKIVNTPALRKFVRVSDQFTECVLSITDKKIFALHFT